MEGYDEVPLLRELTNMRPEQRAAFAAACAERLWPLVERYARAVHLPSGSLSGLRDALDAVWLQDDDERQAVARAQDLAESMIPSEDDRWVLESAYGQNGIAAIAYAARARQTGEPQEAVWAARQLYEAADYSAQQQVLQTSPMRIDEVALHQTSVVRAVLNDLLEDLKVAAGADLLEVQRRSRLGATVLADLFV